MCGMSWHSTVGRMPSINVSCLENVPSSWHEIRLSPLGKTAWGWCGETSWGSDAGLTAWPQCSQARQCWCEGDLLSILCFTSWCLQGSACYVEQQKTRLSKTLLLKLHPELSVYHERSCEAILCQNMFFTHVFLSWHPHWEENQPRTSTIKPKEFSGSLSFSRDSNLGLLIAVLKKSEPIELSRDKDH